MRLTALKMYPCMLIALLVSLRMSDSLGRIYLLTVEQTLMISLD